MSQQGTLYCSQLPALATAKTFWGHLFSFDNLEAFYKSLLIKHQNLHLM